jgi:hypothetical protein
MAFLKSITAVVVAVSINRTILSQRERATRKIMSENGFNGAASLTSPFPFQF